MDNSFYVDTMIGQIQKNKPFLVHISHGSLLLHLLQFATVFCLNIITLLYHILINIIF